MCSTLQLLRLHLQGDPGSKLYNSQEPELSTMMNYLEIVFILDVPYRLLTHLEIKSRSYLFQINDRWILCIFMLNNLVAKMVNLSLHGDFINLVDDKLTP